MENLYNIGLTDQQISNMIEVNYDILNIEQYNISLLINMLKECGCSDRIIRNIVTANPYYLIRDIDDVKNLIYRLKDIGIKNLDVVFDTKPWLLDKDVYEIDNYVDIRQNDGIMIDDIINEIVSDINF